MSVDDYRNLRRSALLGMLWVTFATYGALFMGWAAGAYVGTVENTDQIMPLLAEQLLPGWLVGVLIAAAIAGMMSTSDSKFLVATNAVSYNLYKRFLILLDVTTWIGYLRESRYGVFSSIWAIQIFTNLRPTV